MFNESRCRNRRRPNDGPCPASMRSFRAVAAAILLAASPAAAFGQATVTGRVLESETGNPIPNASVHFHQTAQGTLTGPGGEYSIPEVPAGEHTIEVHALGYRTATRTLTISPSGASGIDFELDVRPIELGGIQVSVLMPDLQPHVDLASREIRESNPKDSGQLLRNLAGVDAVRRGPLGLDPVVRGLRETEVGTYLDGARLFPAGPARMDSPLTHLDPSSVESIEVVTGPYALTWGAGNLSAIRVVSADLPRRGDETLHGSFATGYDTNIEASEVAGALAGRRGPISIWTHGVWRNGSDYEPGGLVLGTVPGDFRSSAGRGKIGVDVGDNSLLTFSGGYQDQGPVDYPGRLLTADFFHASNLAAGFETTRNEGLLRSLEISAYYNAVSHGMNNEGKPTRNPVPMGSRMPPFGLDIRVDSEIQVRGGRAAFELARGPWTANIGGDVYSAVRDARRTIARLTEQPAMMAMPPVGAVLFDNRLWPDATITDVGLYGRLARSLASGIRLTGTLRLDRVSADAASPDSEFLEFLQRVDGSDELARTETNVSAAATASFVLNANWALSLGLGSAVRTADATERYSDHLSATKSQTAAEFMGNPGLRPERSTQADIWLEGSYARVGYHLNLFGRRVSDYITFERTEEDKRLPLPIFPPVVYRYVNGNADFFGGEADIRLGLTNTLTGEIGTSYLWGEQTLFPAASGTEVTEPAFGLAPITTHAGLRYEDVAGMYFLEGTANLVAGQSRVAATLQELETDGYTTIDLRAGIAPVRGINLRVGVDNLFDEEVINHLNSKNPYSGAQIPEPGRVLYVDVSYVF